MEFNIIDAERLNVYLTRAELERENISLSALYSNEKALEYQLTKIFKKAGEETGFGVENMPLEVEIIPIIDGDLFISIHKVPKGQGEIYMEGMVYHFIFRDVEDVIQLCQVVYLIYNGISDLYLYEGKYHLLLRPKHMTREELKRVQGYLWDFGTEALHVGAENVSEGVLCEHGKRICEQNCVELFTKVFANETK